MRGRVAKSDSLPAATRSFPPAPIHPYPLHCLCHWRLSKATDQRQRFVSILLFLLLASTCLPQLSTADKHRRIGKLVETAQWAINGNGFALYVLCWQWLPSKRVSAEISRASNAINLKAKKTFRFLFVFCPFYNSYDPIHCHLSALRLFALLFPSVWPFSCLSGHIL